MKFEITILGSGSALPSLSRNTTAQLVNIRENYFLVDCGEGTQLQMQKFGISPSKINHIFISHLHGDHYLGLIGFLTTQSLLGRTREMHLYANEELKPILDLHLKVADSRLNYPLHFHKLNYNNKELLYESDHVTVHSFPMKHRIPVCGFLFNEKQRELRIDKDALAIYKIPVKALAEIKKGKDFIDQNGKTIKNSLITLPPEKTYSFAFCSDTKYDKNICDYIQGVHTIFHEATFLHKDLEKAKKTFHSTAKQAALIASQAKASELIIGHFSLRYKSINSFLKEAQEDFENTRLAEDGAVIRIY